VEVFNNQNQLVLTKEDDVVFSAANGNLTGAVDLGTTLNTGL
jgi:hypothetical protein